MSMRPQIITKEVTIASASAGDTALFVAPAAGRIRKVRFKRTGGTSATANAKIGSTAVLGTAIVDSTSYATGTPSGATGAAGGRFVEGDIISATLATAVGTPTCTVQVDMVLAANTRG